MIVKTFLVLAEGRNGKPRAARVTTRYPSLDVDEAVIALELDVPADVFEAPTFTVAVERRKVAVAVEAVEPS